jgi:2-polyprenyl-6-methoxyphenol hydroxylase-like FAD-dependent oxidoreductase
MLLARMGYRVLVLDRASFPSDTLSTHWIHPRGVAAISRWGLLDKLASTGCPPIDTYSFDFGAFTLRGSPRPLETIDVGYGPRRTVLDAMLVDAAVDAGVEVRQDFSVDELVFEDGRVAGIRGRAMDGPVVEERAPLVVGADGRHSLVARSVEPEQYRTQTPLEAGYYAYFSGLPSDTFDVYVRPGRQLAALPTHDGLACVVVTWPIAEFEANRVDIEGNFFASLDLAPSFAERVRAGARETRFAGTADLPGYFRKPFGPGWALVGDAGYRTDPCTAQGITDAFVSAELLSAAIDDWMSGRSAFEAAMSRYQHDRDEAFMPIYGLTCEIAKNELPAPDVAQLLMEASRSQQRMNDWASIIAGTLPVSEFFQPAPAPISIQTQARPGQPVGA